MIFLSIRVDSSIRVIRVLQVRWQKQVGENFLALGKEL